MPIRSFSLKAFRGFLALALLGASAAQAFTPSSQPPESSAVPGNVMLALSVEFPTGLQVSYRNADYVLADTYVGYFDNRKCYTYSTTNEVFTPSSAVAADRGCAANDEWSGNVLNWLTMTNLDQFRSVLTGGTRDSFSAKAIAAENAYPGDTTGRTVLIRAFSDRNSYNPVKNIATTTLGVPSALRDVAKFVRSGGYGSKFYLAANAASLTNSSFAEQRLTCAGSAKANATCFNIRVNVCQTVTGVGMEANCQAKYSGVAKPEGLVQEYANNLRFGAFGYLNQSGNDRSGGVLRSAMKSVGKKAATKTAIIDNPNAEWSATTGVLESNPDPDDAEDSDVSNSGLINYLNKFGYAQGYKGNDPVSELFYAAQLYMRGRALPESYSNDLTDAIKDGFPVITGTTLLRKADRDPIIASCQKNFMLAIGDIYTHCDGNLPGSTKAGCTGGTPADTDGLDVQSLWDTTRGLEGLGDTGWVGGAGNATPYVAGLAHWANTSDIRGDLSGKQTISTYFVDVLENGNGVNGMPAAGLRKSQYWLAAKYGGFDTSKVTTNNPNDVAASWDANGDGVPDNWFAGSSPEELRAGLSSAFAKIALEASSNSAASAAVTSSRQTSDSQIIRASYDPKNWSGKVRACGIAQDGKVCEDAPLWEVSDWFNTVATKTYVGTALTASTRKIITSWTTAPTGAPSTTSFSTSRFLWGNLHADQQALLNQTDSLGEDRTNYLRGDRSKEKSTFRYRHDELLGDIVNSGVAYVSGAGTELFGANHPGHDAYRRTNKDRPPVIYVGANDGMLHAFAGGTSKGKELFAYIPGAVYGNLAGLTKLAFEHNYFVDGSPMFGDISKSTTTTTTDSVTGEATTTTTVDWSTILVGGLGAGGKGYYALDITNQKNFATLDEDALKSLPMWEFTSVNDADLGYTFNEPSLDPSTGAFLQIAKVATSTTQKGVWRVVVGNGFGSTSGRAYLYFLDAHTGLTSLKLTADGVSSGNGLAAPTPVDTDGDGLMDTVYAGDFLGRMHKFQFSKTGTGTDAGKYLLAKPSDTAGSPAWRHLGVVYQTGQPITTAPSVSPGLSGKGWIVSFGTGKLNEDADYTDTTAASGFYSIVDDTPFTITQTTPLVASTDVATISYTAGSTSDGRATRTWSKPDLAGKKGWKMDFTGGERVLSNSTLPPDSGIVEFATTKPSGEVCTPGSTGFIMGVGLADGRSNTLEYNGEVVGGMAVDTLGVNKVSPTYADLENQQTIVCNQVECQVKECDDPASDECKGDGTTKILPSSAPKGRYSWREILSK